MTKLMKPIGLGAALVSLLALTAAEAQAQRRGGGGAGIRSSASGSINHGGNRASTRDYNRGGASRDYNRGGGSREYNRGNSTGSRDINRKNVNIDRDVNIDVDVDHDYGCCGNNWGGFYAGAVVGATAAAAWRRGAYYSTLPSTCVSVYRGTVVYYQCGNYWYQPVYSGMTLSYVAIDAP